MIPSRLLDLLQQQNAHEIDGAVTTEQRPQDESASLICPSVRLIKVGRRLR